MAKKHDTKTLGLKIEEMLLAEVGPTEMLRRLREDECGIGYQVDISLRSVQYHLKKIKDRRARETTERETLSKTIGATKLAAAELLRRELHAIERQAPGKITHAQVAVVERIHKALARIETAERKAASRPISTSNGNNGEPDKQETALEQLAREEAERSSAVPPGTAASSPQDVDSSPI
jgi:DNA-binding transcriptional ArsR family regulator